MYSQLDHFLHIMAHLQREPFSRELVTSMPRDFEPVAIHANAPIIATSHLSMCAGPSSFLKNGEIALLCVSLFIIIYGNY
jgi:hypothetical protein